MSDLLKAIVGLVVSTASLMAIVGAYILLYRGVVDRDMYELAASAILIFASKPMTDKEE